MITSGSTSNLLSIGLAKIEIGRERRRAREAMGYVNCILAENEVWRVGIESILFWLIRKGY